MTAAIATLTLVACAPSSEDPSEPTAETGSALSQGAGAAASSVPSSVLANYSVWVIGGAVVPPDPPAQSPCAAPTDAIRYHLIGCADAAGTPLDLGDAASGLYCSTNDGSGVASLEASCPDGWLMIVSAVNGVPIPSNVAVTGGNGNAGVSVALLECPDPPPGLSPHNVIYRGVNNDGIFASETPEGCTPYLLTPH
jgi:hypothetical protein